MSTRDSIAHAIKSITPINNPYEVIDYYIAEGIARFDPCSGHFKLTHGAFFDRDILELASVKAAQHAKDRRSNGGDCVGGSDNLDACELDYGDMWL